MTSLIAPPVIEEVRSVLVVRDDLVEGGTKRPALDAVMGSWPESEIVFPAASAGMGQLALALACRTAGKRCVLFVAARRKLTRETEAARAAGAAIVQVANGRYSVTQARAREYAIRRRACYLPPGLAHPTFVDAVAERARRLDVKPSRVVVTVSSGTLARGLQRAWPSAAFVCVKIGMRPHLEDGHGRTRVVSVPESYDHPALLPPPFPSARFQDAKAWRYCMPGSLFWNIAGEVDQ